MHLNQVIQPWPACSESLLLIMENVLYSGRCFLLIVAACSCLAGADCYRPGKGPEEALLVPKVIIMVHTVREEELVKLKAAFRMSLGIYS